MLELVLLSPSLDSIAMYRLLDPVLTKAIDSPQAHALYNKTMLPLHRSLLGSMDWELETSIYEYEGAARFSSVP